MLVGLLISIILAQLGDAISGSQSRNLCRNPYEDMGVCMAARECSSNQGHNIGACPLYNNGLNARGVCCYIPKCYAEQNLTESKRKKRSLLLDILPATVDAACGLRLNGARDSEHQGQPVSWREQHLTNADEVSADAHQYPWMLALWVKFTRFSLPICGAALIDRKHAISAAHCVSNPRNKYFLRGGSVVNTLPLYAPAEGFGTDDNDNVVIEISDIVVHPAFNPFSFENDIALIIFDEPIRPTRDLFPICLPPPLKRGRPSTEYAGTDVSITGWGCVMEKCGPDKTPKVLMETVMPVVSNDVAMCWFLNDSVTSGRMEYIPKRLFVVGGDISGSTSTCRGDSGSPVVRPIVDSTSVRFEVIGLVSWSKGCGRLFRPSVWVRVETFVQWIMDNMAK